jgi:hypothetical protein
MIDSHVPYVAFFRSDLVFSYFIGPCSVIVKRFAVKRFADKRYAFSTGHFRESLRGGVYNTDRFIMRGAHRDVVLPSHYRYERHVDNLFEIQNVS